MNLEHTWILPLRIRGHFLVDPPIEPSDFVIREGTINGIEGFNDVDSVQGHCGWIVGCGKANWKLLSDEYFGHHLLILFRSLLMTKMELRMEL